MTASRTIFLGTATPVTNTCSRLMATNDLPVVNQGDAQHSPRASFVCLWVSRPNECVTNNVLPDACLEIIWDGQWLFMAGPDTGPVPVAPRPGGTFAGLRFRPDRAPSLLGAPASEMLHRRVALAELWATLARPASPTGWPPCLPEKRQPKGNLYLRAALGQMATGAAKTDTFRGQRYRRLCRRMPKAKALGAIERSIPVIIFHLLADPTATFEDLGADYYEKRGNKERRTRSLVQQLEALGRQVTLTAAAWPTSSRSPQPVRATARAGLRPTPRLAGQIVASTPRLSLSSQVSLRKCCSGTADGSIAGQLLATADSRVGPSPRRVRQSGVQRRRR